MGLFGPPNIEKMKQKRDVKGLINALDEKWDKEIRYDAIVVLGEIGDPKAVDRLVEIVDHDRVDFYVVHSKRSLNEAAIDALGNIGDPRAVVPILKSLEKVNRGYVKSAIKQIGAPAVEHLSRLALDEKWQWFAIEILSEINDKSVIEPLLMHLHDKNLSIQRTVVQALQKHNFIPIKTEDLVIFLVIAKEWKKCTQLGIVAVIPLLSYLDKQPDLETKDNILAVLAEIGSPVIEFLNEYQEEQNEREKNKIKIILADLRDPETLRRRVDNRNLVALVLGQLKEGVPPDMEMVKKAMQLRTISVNDICEIVKNQKSSKISQFLDALIDENIVVEDVLKIVRVLNTKERAYTPRKRNNADIVIINLNEKSDAEPMDRFSTVGDDNESVRRFLNSNFTESIDAIQYLMGADKVDWEKYA